MKKIIKMSSEYIQIGIGILLASIGLKAFLLPNGFLDGGATGIAILVSTQLDVSISLLLMIISLPFFILAWYTVSRKILVKSVLSIISLALVIQFENFQPITEDKLLIAIFGGIFLGAGIGLTIKNGSVLDGSEILGIFINDRFGISIGKSILIFNIFLFGATAMILSIEAAMYSILTFLVTSKVIDLFIQGFEDYVGLMIVSSHHAEIQEKLVEVIGSGMTVYKGGRGYGSRGVSKGTDIIHTVINRIDMRRTYNVIDKIDAKAFIIEFDINHVQGGVLRKYLSREPSAKLSNTVLD